MKQAANPYFTFVQLKNIAAQKYVQAVLAPEGPQRDALLKEAETYAGRAKVKYWILAGW